MAQLSIIVASVFLVVAINEINGFSRKHQNSVDRDGFVYIGSLKHLNALTRTFDESNYYVSVNPSVWATGRDDCRKRGVDLLSVESRDESEFLAYTLDKYGLGVDYWTSGMYDSSQQIWRWAAGGNALPPSANVAPVGTGPGVPSWWAPWAPGFPPANPNSLHRVVLNHLSEFDHKWKTVPNSQILRYICEERV